MDEVKGKRPKQLRSSNLCEIEWTKEAIEAALACMYSPKTTKACKVSYINMRDALSAGVKTQGLLTRLSSEE